MYIYNFDEMVSNTEFSRSEFSYPYNTKFNGELCVLFINFEFNLPESTRRDDYFEIGYRFSVPGAWREVYNKLNNNNHRTVEKLDGLRSRVKESSYVFNRESSTLVITVDIGGARPEAFNDIVQELHDHFTGIVGLSLVDKLGPCVKHFNCDGDLMEPQIV